MTAEADSLLTIRWRDRSFVLRAPEQVDELARRLRQKGLAHIAESVRGAVAEDTTAGLKVLSDAEREAVCAVLTDAESDPALRRAFNLLCAEPEPSEATYAPCHNPAWGRSRSLAACKCRGRRPRPFTRAAAPTLNERSTIRDEVGRRSARRGVADSSKQPGSH